MLLNELLKFRMQHIILNFHTKGCQLQPNNEILYETWNHKGKNQIQYIFVVMPHVWYILLSSIFKTLNNLLLRILASQAIPAFSLWYYSGIVCVCECNIVDRRIMYFIIEKYYLLSDWVSLTSPVWPLASIHSLPEFWHRYCGEYLSCQRSFANFTECPEKDHAWFG